MMPILTQLWPVRSSSITVEQWCKEYDALIAARFITPKTLRCRRVYAAHICEHLGNMPLWIIRPVHVATMIRAIYDSGRQVTARRVRIEAIDLFNEAVMAGHIDRNPAASIKGPKSATQRSRLNFDQFERIFWYAREKGAGWASSAFLLALVSAQRRSDIVSMHAKRIENDHLHVEQQKTGARIRLPLEMRLDVAGMSLGNAIEDCFRHGTDRGYFVSQKDGAPVRRYALTTRFAQYRDKVISLDEWQGRKPASLHEIRSLSERLYRAQGVDTQTLLGHKRRSTTDIYNDDRGINAGTWKTLTL